MLKVSLKNLFIMLLPAIGFCQEKGLDQRINELFTPISNGFQKIILFNMPYTDIPFIVVLLVLGALIFTVYFSFINIVKIPLSLRVVSGKYDVIENEESSGPSGEKIKSKGELSHFQALTTAVSGTVGLGNIAGVAIAVATGGPGATFWMILCGLLGMTTKFVECTLGVKYRDVGPDGTVYGGPMYYISKGFKDIKKEKLGKYVALIFSFLCVGASFGGGNAAQSNQAASQLANMLGWNSSSSGTIIGFILAIVVGLVIIGGIKRIATVTEKIVPLMAVIYIIACLIIIFAHYDYIGTAFYQIIDGAFSPKAGLGGFIGVMVQGFRRAAFSNEAGAGSAPIAHSAVKTNYPASEGIVALLEPFIDTVVICTMTALVIVIYNEPGIFAYGQDVIIDGVKVEGSVLTSMAFGDVIPWFPSVLTIAIILFAISTMISWSYYGVQSWMYIFGRSKRNELIYKLLFLVFIIIGAAANMDSVWGFSDAMILGMVFPNMFGLLFLFPKVREELRRYLKRIKESVRK